MHAAENQGGVDDEDLPPPSNGRWGWVVIFASFMIHVINDGITYSFGIFYKEFLTYFHESKGKTALIVSMLVGVTLGSGPISSVLVNRFGCKIVTVAGGVISGICVIGSAFARNVITLIFSIGVGAGLGFGLVYLPAIISVSVWFDNKRSLATGIAVCGSGFGTFIFAPIMKILIKEYGWRGAMLIVGGVVLNCVPMGLLMRPLPEPVSVATAASGTTTEPTFKSVPQTFLKLTSPPVSQSTSLSVLQSRKSSLITSSQSSRSSKMANLENITQSQLKLHSHHHRHGVMSRPDILYQGSGLHQLRERVEQCSREMQEKSLEQRPPKEEQSEEVATLHKMLDLRLLLDPVFILFSISNFLTNIGYYIPYIYTVAVGEQLNVSHPEYLISVIGISNLLGRVVLGYISDKPWVNRLYAYSMCLSIAGISTCLSMVCWEFWGLALYAATFGFSIGAYVGLTSVVLVDLLGLERLTNAFGLTLLFQGISSFAGPPFAGWLYDTYSSYAPGFYSGGGAVAVSGVILLLIPPLQRRTKKKMAQSRK